MMKKESTGLLSQVKKKREAEMGAGDWGGLRVSGPLSVVRPISKALGRPGDM